MADSAANSVTGSQTHASVPDDLLASARKRVENLVFVLLLMSMIGIPLAILTRLTSKNLAPTVTSIGLSVHLAVIVCDVALLAIARSPRFANQAVLLAALVYQVVVCGILSIALPVLYFEARGAVPPLTWAGVLIVVFPLVVPVPPKRALAASFLSAATGPVGLAAMASAGFVAPVPGDYGESVVTGIFLVIIAYFGARIVYGYQTDVAKARQMGSYELVDLIGQGGMGEVWQASHRLLARPAAIKLIKREVLDAGGVDAATRMRQRFEREAQATAQLESPHTVELYDFGISDDGDFYYVMELLRGIDLDSLVKKFGPLPASRAVFLLAQICDSLADAHDRGLVHRDIKPANIFLSRVGGKFDFVKVLDFGLVKVTADSTVPQGDVNATLDNKLRGTPSFMAPEMVTSRNIDPRADIYSLGCVAYWLLTGSLVFDETSAMNMAIAHAHKVPVPIEERGVQPVPPALAALIMRCLEKEPDERPQSAEELGDLLAELDIGVRWTQRDAREWWRAHLPDHAAQRSRSATKASGTTRAVT